jgi:hypothetical protein
MSDDTTREAATSLSKPASRPSPVARLAPVAWITLAVLAASLYGILNDQVTVTISPEYFSVFKRRQFGPLLEAIGWEEAPTRVQAIAIGTAATWWFGLLLGIMVTTTGVIGRRRRLTTPGFMKSVALVMAVTAATSLVFGLFGYTQAPGWHQSPEWLDRYGAFLHGIEDTRSAITVGCWHDGAYLGGMIGTMLASVLVWRWRSRVEDPGNSNSSGGNRPSRSRRMKAGSGEITELSGPTRNLGSAM